MLYDIPGRTGTPIETETLVRLAAHDRIMAVKDAKGDLTAGSEVMARTDLAFYSGDDALNLAWLAHGGVGIVSVVGHVVTARYAEMVQAVDKGDLGTAIRIHRELLPVVRAIMTKSSQGAIMAKAALHAQRVIPTRTTRPPLIDATDAQVAELRTALESAGVQL
jgi:4-hydroxy-tetrahydrodipicolinate synthase